MSHTLSNHGADEVLVCRPQLVVACVMMMFQQFTGINAVRRLPLILHLLPPTLRRSLSPRCLEHASCCAVQRCPCAVSARACHSRPDCFVHRLARSCEGLVTVQVIFYLPLLLSSLGSTSHASLEDALIIGGVNVASTLVAVALVDRLGRRPILIAGTHLR